MHLLTDETFQFTNPHNCAISQCRVRIYGHPEWAMVIWTEIAENQGLSVTDAAEYLASQIQDRFTLDPLETLWIDHYSAFSYKDSDRKQEYSLVQLRWNPDERSYSNPEWSYLEKVQVDYLIAN